MKAIMISTQPKWVEKILNGIKKDEIRKGTAIGKAINKLIAKQGVAPMLIYCTKNGGLLTDNGENHYYIVKSQECKKIVRETDIAINGKVVARFNATAEEITPRFTKDNKGVWYITENKSFEELCIESCLCSYQLNDYLRCKKGTDIHINNLEIFDEPKEINEFNVWGIDYPTGIIDPLHDCNVYYKKKLKPLTRAPQSWCYIEI